MATPSAADAARMLKVQLYTSLLVSITAIVFWLNAPGQIITWIVTALAVMDAVLCGYFFFKFRSVRPASAAQAESPEESLRRLNDSADGESQY
jgi:hypothetical protein